MPTIHHAAATGFANRAATYAAGRPDYPSLAQDWLRRDIGLTAGKAVLDLGAGTGKFLPVLAATGASVLAVEPVAAMIAQLRHANPGVDVRIDSAEAIPIDDGTLDAVVCAQSFHWFATPAAVGEIRRVLKPGGTLGLIWNVRDESVAWVAALTQIMRPYEGTTPRYASGDWRRVVPAPGFGPLHERRMPHGHTGDPERVIVDRVLSTSFIAALPPVEQARVAAAVRALIAATPALAGRASVTYPYETAAFWSVKTA